MLEDFQGIYNSNSRSSCPSLSDSSGNGSFHSWEAVSEASPPSTRHDSSDFMKLEDMELPTSHTPEAYVLLNDMSSTSPMGFGHISEFSEQSMVLPEHKVMQDYSTMASFNGLHSFGNVDLGSFQPNQGLPIQTPALESGLSSPLSMNFVDPSQTTFNSSFDLQSHFNSPASNYNPNLSPDNLAFDSMASLKYEACTVSPTTPSRLSTTPYRASKFPQSNHGAASASAALCRAVQLDSNAVRRARKNMKRISTCELKVNDTRIGREKASAHRCLWPQCGRKFARSEHLKRHQRTHMPSLDIPAETFKCPFCGKPFKGERGDNLAQHVKLHIDGRKRTLFHPDAEAWIENRKRKSKATVASKRETQTKPRSRGTEY